MSGSTGSVGGNLQKQPDPQREEKQSKWNKFLGNG